MLKSAPSLVAGGRPDAESKNPGGEAGVCHGTSDLLAGFLTWSASRSAQITTTIPKVMPALQPVKRAIIKNYPDAPGLRPAKHRRLGTGAIDSTRAGGQLGA